MAAVEASNFHLVVK